jgi:hypothetical protein
MTRFRLLTLATLAAAALLTGSAYAYVCHPNAPGTRLLTLEGAVRSVAVHGKRVDFVVANGRTCSRVAWSTATGAARSHYASCTGRATQMPYGAARVGVDERGRPTLFAGGRQLPLPLSARAASVNGKLALVEGSRPDRGVMAVRLTDGAFTFLGPDGRAFAPRVDARGVVFHDGESKAALRAGKVIAKFIPRRAVVRGFATTTAPLTTGGPIQALAMDGLRVALAIGATSAGCDRVLYWNVAWSPVQRISAPLGPTCAPGVRGTRISAVAIGGFRAEWLAASRDEMRLIAGSPLCQEWVVRLIDSDRLTGIAADGATIAYATTSREQGLRGATSIGIVSGGWRAHQITTGIGAPRSLAANGTRVAILWPDGTAEIRGVSGRLIARINVGDARSLALEGTRLAVLRGDRLELFDARSGRHVRGFPAHGATGLDLHYGVAAYARGRDAVVLDTWTGRTAVVGRAPSGLIGVQIEGPGLAYAWSGARRGVARFVTTAQLDRALGGR